MCRYCPPRSLVCLEPPADPPAYCARCGDPDPTDALTERQAEHLGVDAETALVCFDCLRALRAELAQVECALCRRMEDANLVDRVDTLAGAALIPVCHGCLLGHAVAMNDLADVAREAANDHMEASFELGGPLPTDPDFIPAEVA